MAFFFLFPIVILSVFGHAANAQQPLIYDTDHGPFIDDIFALGLLLNSQDIVDMQVVMATSEDPALSALCIAAQMELSGISLADTDTVVAMGETLPPYEDRGSVCGIPGILGFGIEPICRGFFNDTDPMIVEDGVDYVARLLIDSDRDDWWYLVVGGQTSLKRLIEQYPDAAAKIDTLVVMAGNWCADFEPYPGVMAPTDETVRCDAVYWHVYCISVSF
jgi:inosine-uridine nucleoside N-ribohydrolase